MSIIFKNSPNLKLSYYASIKASEAYSNLYEKFEEKDPLFNSRINNLSKNYSIPVYLHTENSLIKIVEFLKNAKGIFTDAIDKIILNEYISNLTKLLL